MLVMNDAMCLEWQQAVLYKYWKGLGRKGLKQQREVKIKNMNLLNSA